MCYFNQCRCIGHLHQWIRNRFDQQSNRMSVSENGFEACQIHKVDQEDGDTHFIEVALKQNGGCAIQIQGGHHGCPSAHSCCQQRGVNRSHPRGKGLGGFTLFQLCHGRFKGGQRWATVSQIDIAFLPCIKNSIQLIHAFIEVTHGGVNGSCHRGILA